MNILPADPRRRNAVLTAILALSVLYFVNTYIGGPKRARADATRLRLADLETRVDSVPIGDSIDQTVLAHRLEVYEAHLAGLENLIPSSEEMASLLEAISVQERIAGVEVTMLRPEVPQAGKAYDSWSYEMTIEGGYHAIGAFLTAIASLESIMVPMDLVLDTGPAPTTAGRPDASTLAVARFRIQTYVASPGGSATHPILTKSSATPQ